MWVLAHDSQAATHYEDIDVQLGRGGGLVRRLKLDAASWIELSLSH